MASLSAPNQLIKAALEYAVEQSGAGKSPNESVKLAAEKFELNPEFTRRVGTAFNTALTLTHFRENPGKKAADFDICDPDLVISERYGHEKKSSARQNQEWFASDNQYLDQVPDYNKMLTDPGFRKISGILHESAKVDNTKARSDLTAHAWRSLNALGKIASEARIGEESAKYRLSSAFTAIGAMFKRAAEYRTAFDEFESQVYATHGDKAVPYLDLVYKDAGVKDERGIHDAKYFSFEPCKEALAFDTLMVEIDRMSKASAERLEAETMHKQSEALMRHIAALLTKESESPIAGTGNKVKDLEEADSVEEPPAADAGKKILEEIKQDQKVAAEGKRNPIDDSNANLFDELSELVGIAKETVNSNPLARNNKADNRSRAAILQELITLDPVLRKESPGRVAMAYEQITRVSPRMSMEKEAVRAVLRMMLAQQSMGPFEFNQLTETEINRMKMEAMHHGYGIGSKGGK